MKDFITEIELSCGTYNNSDYPLKKEVCRRKIKKIRYYGRTDFPDLIYSIEKLNQTSFNIKITLRNTTPGKIVVNKIKVVKLFENGKGLLGKLKPDIWLFRQGTKSPGDDVRFVPLLTDYRVNKDTWSTKEWYRKTKSCKEIYSETYGLLRNIKANRNLFLGFTTLKNQHGRINIIAKKMILTIEAAVDLNKHLLLPGSSVSSEKLRMSIMTDTKKIIGQYVNAVAKEMKPVFPKKIPTGWSSWQYYRRNITENDIIENINALKKDKYPIEYILIDDGYHNNSNWLKTNNKFPHGLKWIAKQIRNAGYKPGLWIAPLTTYKNSTIYKKHKDWLLKDAEGSLLVKQSHMGDIYVIDYTIKGACRWLAKLIKRLVKDIGIKYIKLDGPIFRYYANGVFSEKNTTAIQIIRKALRIIRNNSKGALIEGEGVYGPSIGLVDVQRTAQDIQTSWELLKNNLQVNLMSNYLHKKWWINNPDAFILRDTSTPNHYNPHEKEHVLTRDELHTEITAHMLSGGEVMLTDRMSILKEERKKLISLFLPPCGEAAEPIDIFNGEECPCIFRLKRKNKTWIAVFNWSNRKKNFIIDLKNLGIKRNQCIMSDFWDNKKITVYKKIRLKQVRPRSVKLLILT